MASVDRNQPKRSKASESTYSLMEFLREFPDDAACLEWLWRNRYSEDGEQAECPRCAKVRSFKRYLNKTRARHVWTCTACSFQLSPTAGTIFHKSPTALNLWFYAMYIMASTRCGVSAKQLERELGVTYKTAWRMFNLIRNQLMVQDGGKLSGKVEADETYIGGKLREGDRRRLKAKGLETRGPASKPRVSVFAAVERDGEVRARVIPNSRAHVLTANVRQHVAPDATLYTDDWHGYAEVGREYTHKRINHSERVYVDGDIHTQTVEGFFSTFKNGIRGVYHSVSKKWLQGYLNEYAWRYHRRGNGRAMFLDLLSESVSRDR
jgi:transposase